jgi:hypothetical protein
MFSLISNLKKIKTPGIEEKRIDEEIRRKDGRNGKR